MTWKPRTYLWEWQLHASPAEVWPYVADTQRFNQVIGLPAVTYTEIPQEIGGSQLIGQSSKWGLQVEFEDYPFQWIRNQEFTNHRKFRSGPIAHTGVKLTLTPNETGTLARYEVEITPANLVGTLATAYQFGWLAQKTINQAFEQIDGFLQNQAAQPFQLPASSIDEAARARLDTFGRQLIEQGFSEQWVNRLVDLLTTEADFELIRIRPYKLAKAWQAPRQEILEMFLSATKLGLLNMQWDILCPLCRGGNDAYSSLDQLHKGAHCPTCNIDFEANFAKHVELTFQPHSQIRGVYDHQYCVGGPMVTPHILAHQIIQPHENRAIQLTLEPGEYRLRTQKPGQDWWLTIEETGSPVVETVCLVADEEQIQTQTTESNSPLARLTLPAGGRLTFQLTNQAPYSQRFYIEQGEWFTNAVSAAEVTALQHFRDLFSDEVLRPGEEIGIQGMTILFSDLVGSTAMYNQRGDAHSYAIVRRQFDFLQRIVRANGGTIVKTIGDAIMAAFINPVNGVGAAWAIQQEIDTFNANHPDDPITIKLGLHKGPCIAVTLNERLDYFGTTVNLAARLEGQSKGNDIVISEDLWQEPSVQQLIQSKGVKVTEFETAIKGFDEHFRLYRLTLS